MNRAALRALIRLTVANTTQWPDATLDAWLNHAIRLYSAHRPRRLRHALALTTGTQAYNLPEGTTTVVSVEYPAGSTPAEHIPYAHYTSYRFTHGACCYTVRGLADDTTPANDDYPAQIHFAEPVTTGQTASIEYLGPHTLPTADTDEITVPDHHTEALTSYVTFCAAVQLESAEGLAVDDTTITLSQLGESARRAWLRWRDIMDRLMWLGNDAIPSAPPTWERIGL